MWNWNTWTRIPKIDATKIDASHLAQQKKETEMGIRKRNTMFRVLKEVWFIKETEHWIICLGYSELGTITCQNGRVVYNDYTLSLELGAIFKNWSRESVWLDLLGTESPCEVFVAEGLQGPNIEGTQMS